jgi:hypothetical protein
MLVLARGGAGEPTLLIADPRWTVQAGMPGRLLAQDDHIVAADAGPVPPGEPNPQEFADVLVTYHDVTGALARYPGAGLAVGTREAVFRDGARLGHEVAVGHVDLGLLGSFLHCWRTGRLPFDSLASSAVLVGTVAGDGLFMAVAGRLVLRSADVARRVRTAS